MPILAVIVSAAMMDAVKRHAKIQSRARGYRVTMSDVVTASLRLSGFERDDVLEKLAAGKVVDIDVRRRTPSYAVLNPAARIREYMELKGCVRPLAMKRSLHMSIYDVRRGIEAMLNAKLAHEKPFDRPRIIHWTARCDCKVALAPSDKVMRNFRKMQATHERQRLERLEAANDRARERG